MHGSRPCLAAARGIAVLSLLFVGFAPAAALAVTPADWKACESSYPAEKQVAACNKILASPGLSVDDRIKAYVSRADGYQFAYDYKAAYADLTEVIKLGPNKPENYEKRARLMQSANEIDRPIEDYSAAIALQPTGYRLNTRAELYRRKGDLDRAAADFTQAAVLDGAMIAKNPNQPWGYYQRSKDYLGLGDVEAALRDYGEFVARRTDSDVRRLAERGDLYLRKGDVARAIVDYTAAVDGMPDNTESYAKRALAYRLQGDHKRAILDYDRIIQMNDSDPSVWVGRGLAYAGAGKLERAIVDFTGAIDIFPEDDMAFYNRGQAQRELGNIELAIADYSAAIALNPRSAVAFNSRGRAYLAQNDLDHALDDFNRAIALNGRFAAAYCNRAMLHQAAGRTADAIADFGRAIVADPGDRNFLIARGLALSAAGSDADAEKDFTAALKIDPVDAQAYVGRARARLKLGATAAALDDADRAILIDRKLVPGYRARADIEDALGRQTEAAADRAAADREQAAAAEARRVVETAARHPRLKVTISGSFPRAPPYLKMMFKFDSVIEARDDEVTYRTPGLKPFKMASGEPFEEDFAGLCNNQPTSNRGHRSVTGIFDKNLFQVDFRSNVDFATGACRGKFVHYKERFVVDVSDGGCKFSYWQLQDQLGNTGVDVRVADQTCVVEQLP
jgi:tetratricopeptide (TPR) repeat protein